MLGLLSLFDSLSDDAIRFAAAAAARVPALAAGVSPATRRDWAAGGKFARALAATICGVAPADDGAADALLRSLAGDPARVVRDLAQIGLAERVRRNPGGFAMLSTMADSPDPDARAAAVRAAVVILRGRPGRELQSRAFELLERALFDPAPEPTAGLVTYAVGTLAADVDPARARELVKRLWQRPEPEFRRRALAAITMSIAVGTWDTRGMIEAGALDADPQIRAEARRAARRLGWRQMPATR